MIRIVSYNEKSWLYAKNEKFSLIYIVIFHNKPEFFIISHFSLYDLLLLVLSHLLDLLVLLRFEVVVMCIYLLLSKYCH